MNQGTTETGAELGLTPLSDKTLELAHEFLSAVFMGVRTAQIHDATNDAFVKVTHRVYESGAALFSAVGTFEVKVVDDSFFVNGVRLRFSGKTLKSMRSLRVLLESQGMGGFRMSSAPSYDSVRRLISLFATGARSNFEHQRQLFAEIDVSLYGTQRLSDRHDPVRVDRRVFAVHSYAKLLLGLREHAAIIDHVRLHGPSEGLRARIRLVRVIQDLAELCDDRLDLLLKLASNARGADPTELAAANTCVLSLALGHALELHRKDLGDIGMAALFSQIGRRAIPEASAPESARNAAGLSRLLSESGLGQGAYTRAMVLCEQVIRPTTNSDGVRRSHPYSRLVRAAAAYSRLVTGLDSPEGRGISIIEAIRALQADRSGWLDPRIVDLMVNLLRAFPRGTPVTLSSGQAAVIAEVNAARLDRPRVRIAGNPPALVDLAAHMTGSLSVLYTQMYLGTEPAMGGVVHKKEAGPRAPQDGVEMLPAQQEKLRPRENLFRPALPSLSDLARGAGASSATPESSPAVVPSANPPSSQESDDVVQGDEDAATEPQPIPDRPAPRVTGTPLTEDLLPPPSRAPRPNLIPEAITEPSDPLPDLMILDPVVAREQSSTRPNRDSSDRSVFPASASTSLIGTYLAGKYRILQQIGEGGMGAVYIANQEPIDRKVAVKVLLASLAGDKVAMKRFEREAKAISRMRHPNTVTIYDFGYTAANELYIVMEYLEGETLAELLRGEGAVSADRAARIIRQACESLSEAHDAGIVHRDLKPDNIFLTQFGRERDWVKVLDFGLAKLADQESASSTLTQQGKVFGTPRYMSPEQAQGIPLDARSDLYTLGVVLFELITGRALFDAGSMVALLVKHISEPPPLPSSVRPDLHIDERLESVVLKALAKSPDDRYASCEEFARALEPFAYPNSALPGPPQARAAPPRFPPARKSPPKTIEPAASAEAPGGGADAVTPEVGQEELDGLLSDFLSELTPLEHLAEDPENPFVGFTPGEPKD